MCYYKAIIKELQRDKSYDRIVISKDLEQVANNSDETEKYLIELFEKIRHEAVKSNGENIPIILISKDEIKVESDKEPIEIKQDIKINNNIFYFIIIGVIVGYVTIKLMLSIL